MIGSKRKTIAIFRELVAEGISEQLFKRVHAPVGLDIGAVTPEEIAVAITAELIAHRRNVERELPHMSWFHRRQVGDEDEHRRNVEREFPHMSWFHRRQVGDEEVESHEEHT